MKPDELVAVYGSLRQGLGNHHVLNGASFIETGVVKGFGMVSLGAYPALSPLVENSDVKVEVYNMPHYDVCKRLDMLEGYPQYYNRKKVEVALDDGNVVDAWVYYIEDEFKHHEVVSSGDWYTYLKEEEIY